DAEPPEDLEVVARVALHVRDAPDDKHRYVADTLEQRARDHEAVAAVVAAAGDDRHTPELHLRERGLDGRNDLPPGVLHEHERRDAQVVDGRAIGLAHLFRCEHTHGESPSVSVILATRW